MTAFALLLIFGTLHVTAADNPNVLPHGACWEERIENNRPEAGSFSYRSKGEASKGICESEFPNFVSTEKKVMFWHFTNITMEGNQSGRLFCYGSIFLPGGQKICNFSLGACFAYTTKTSNCSFLTIAKTFTEKYGFCTNFHWDQLDGFPDKIEVNRSDTADQSFEMTYSVVECKEEQTTDDKEKSTIPILIAVLAVVSLFGSVCFVLSIYLWRKSNRTSAQMDRSETYALAVNDSDQANGNNQGGSYRDRHINHSTNQYEEILLREPSVVVNNTLYTA